MVEQNCECSAVARSANSREQVVKLVLPCGRAAGGKVIINVSTAGQIHDTPQRAEEFLSPIEVRPIADCCVGHHVCRVMDVTFLRV
jgi:uncharacterized protein (DUF849 family)